MGTLTRIRHIYLAVALVASPPAGGGLLAQQGTVADAASLIRAAYDRYHATWYQSLSFVQQTIRYRPDGTSDTSIWYEAYSAPGKLRIDVAPLSDHTMYLFRNDSQYVFLRDTLASQRSLIHPLLLLGFDLYALAPETTITRLEALGIDLSIIREDRWNDRPVTVVGASKNDSTHAQFWMDTERLVFVRMLTSTGSRVQEVIFDRYHPLAGGWIAPEVVISLNGKIVMRELYSDLQTGLKLDPAFFDPNSWRSAVHWRVEP